MVTGLKVAVGATLSKVRARKTQAAGEAGAADPHSGAAAGGDGGYKSEDEAAAGFDGSKPFVMGMRVRKIWWKHGVRHTSDDVAGSTMGDDRASADAAVDFVDDFTFDVAAPAGEVFVNEDAGLGIEESNWIFP
jgi:hypothetical protein